MKTIRLGMLMLAAVGLAGCAYHPQPITVFGRSGAQFTAPTLCAALIQCQNSSETGCYYNSATVTTTTAAGAVESMTDVCKAAAK